MKIEIPMKLPSLNEYINQCRCNKYAGAYMKEKIEKDMLLFINKLPVYKNPITITFTWVEKNKRRDLDNICFGKKFILDCLQKAGKINNDNQEYVKGFEDRFEIGDDYKVIVEIEEEKDVN